MSLISTASPWITEEPQKKRAATLRKTLKKPLSLAEDASSAPDYTIREFDPPSYAALSKYESTEGMTSASTSSNMETDSEVGKQRDQRVQDVLQKMHSLNIENDGKNLADFKPLTHPVVPQSPPPLPSSAMMRPIASANNYSLDKNSDYRAVYQQSSGQAYYNPLPPRHEDKLLDKINYMIHLLEEQANEKTNNQLEEFVMFSLVGVFLIYVLDSFSRSARYIR